jgi:hypothetical protein
MDRLDLHEGAFVEEADLIREVVVVVDSILVEEEEGLIEAGKFALIESG